MLWAMAMIVYFYLYPYCRSASLATEVISIIFTSQRREKHAAAALLRFTASPPLYRSPATPTAGESSSSSHYLRIRIPIKRASTLSCRRRSTSRLFIYIAGSRVSRCTFTTTAYNARPDELLSRHFTRLISALAVTRANGSAYGFRRIRTQTQAVARC